jgi:tRNA A-37 threonylcarbamoyl transferase component Bud32
MARDVAEPRGRLRWWVNGERTPLLDAVIAEPDRVLTGPSSVARARVGRKRFYRVASEGEGAALYVKVFRVSSGWPRLRSLLRRSKARREARLAREVRARGFEVAAPTAVGEERRHGFVLRSFVVVPEREGHDLRQILSDPALPRERRRELIVGFAELARRLHDSGIDQDDFSPNNFLVDAAGRFILLDFERCRVARPLGARRWTLLAKLHRHDLRVPRTDRLRFLRTYLGPGTGRAERRRAWQGIDAAFWKIRRRDARRAAHAAFRVGRHVGRDGAVWVVRGREKARTRRLELGPAESRRGWIVAHQLERLGLPALPPVRLGPGWLELLEPEPVGARGEREEDRRRAARRLERYGRFVRDPEWLAGPEGALLADPTTFRLGL